MLIDAVMSMSCAGRELCVVWKCRESGSVVVATKNLDGRNPNLLVCVEEGVASDQANALSRSGAFAEYEVLCRQSPENIKSLCVESANDEQSGYDQLADNCDCGTWCWNQRENMPKKGIMKCTSVLCMY